MNRARKEEPKIHTADCRKRVVFGIYFYNHSMLQFIIQFLYQDGQVRYTPNFSVFVPSLYKNWK